MSQVLESPVLRSEPTSSSLSSWTEPELSIGERSGSMGFLGMYKCWKLKEKSPAHEVWKSILRPIADLLEDQFEHFDAKDEHLQIEAFMIGKNVETSVPTIVFSCRTKLCRKRALTVIRKSSILKPHPGFRLADCTKLPSTVAKDESADIDLDPGVYANGPIRRPGISITVVTPTGEASGRIATLGGFVRVNGALCGLTVKHALAAKDAAEELEDSDTDEFEFFEDDQLEPRLSDTDSLVDITSQGSTGTSTTRYGSMTDAYQGVSLQARPPHTHLLEKVRYIVKQAIGILGKAFREKVLSSICKTKLGFTNYSSQAEHSIPIEKTYIKLAGWPFVFGLGIDWMLVSLDQDDKSELMQSTQSFDTLKAVLTNSFQLADGTRCVPQVTATEPRDTDIAIFTPRSSNPLNGRLSGAPCLSKPRGCYKFQEYWSATSLDENLVEGDSGSWVLARGTNELVGQVVAGYLDDGIAYIIPAHRIFKSIEAQMSTKPSLSTAENWTLMDEERLFPYYTRKNDRKPPQPQVTPPYLPLTITRPANKKRARDGKEKKQPEYYWKRLWSCGECREGEMDVDTTIQCLQCNHAFCGPEDTHCFYQDVKCYI